MSLKKRNWNFKGLTSGLAITFTFYLLTLVAWIVNIVKLFNCDFESPYKEEIIHATGALYPPLSVITVWY